MKTKHDRIFLHVCGDYADACFGETIWKDERLNEDDVEYIRADIAEADIARLKEELENEQARGIHSCGPNCKMSGCVNHKLREELAAKNSEIDLLTKQFTDMSDSVSIQRYNNDINELRQQLAAKEKPDFRQMREMLRAMQAGELTVSRGIEILEEWWEGKWSDDMLPPVRQDLIEDSTPVEIIDRLKQQIATKESNSSDLPIESEYLANSMQFGADMVTKYVNVVKQSVMLRKALLNAERGLNFWGDVLSPKCKEALAATQDLSGYILCDAKPIILASGVTLNTTKGYIHCATGDSLYKARKQP